MPPRAPPKSSPLAKLLDPSLEKLALRTTTEVELPTPMQWCSSLLRPLLKVSYCCRSQFLVAVSSCPNIQYPRKARFVKVWCSSGQGRISAFAHLESSLFSSKDLKVRGRRGLKDFIVDYRAVGLLRPNDRPNSSSTLSIYCIMGVQQCRHSLVVAGYRKARGLAGLGWCVLIFISVAGWHHMHLYLCLDTVSTDRVNSFRN